MAEIPAVRSDEQGKHRYITLTNTHKDNFRCLFMHFVGAHTQAHMHVGTNTHTRRCKPAYTMGSEVMCTRPLRNQVDAEDEDGVLPNPGQGRTFCHRMTRRRKGGQMHYTLHRLQKREGSSITLLQVSRQRRYLFVRIVHSGVTYS